MPEPIRKLIELNPVLIRGVLVAVAALLAQIAGHTVIEDSLITTIIDFFTSIAALVTALWARGKVIAENKVVAWKLDPAVDIVSPGIATTGDESGMRIAADLSQTQGEVRSSQRHAA